MTNRNQPPFVLTARWIIPIDGPPQEGGTVTIAGERIVAVESKGSRTADLDLGDTAVLPGFVNAHTHLDLSNLRGRIPPSRDFTAWLRAVVAQRRGFSPGEVEAAVRNGLAESLACGTTLIGDISGQGLSWPILAASPLRAVVFYELLGLTHTRARQAWKDGCAWLRAHPDNRMIRAGLSPHAPYSVRATLFRAAASLARQQTIPLAIHLAESQAEEELLRFHRGPFVKFLSELGVWDPDGLVWGSTQILDLCAKMDPVLFIHGNYLDPVTPLPLGCTLVFCPRTHAAFGHNPYPLRAFLEKGVRVALGTDSLASNPDLDVLGEARFLHRRYPDLPGALLLRLITLAGAEALGWQQETGSLTPGKSADLVVMPLAGDNTPDPCRFILESSLKVTAVMCRGRWVIGNGLTP